MLFYYIWCGLTQGSVFMFIHNNFLHPSLLQLLFAYLPICLNRYFTRSSLNSLLLLGLVGIRGLYLVLMQNGCNVPDMSARAFLCHREM